MDVRQLEDIVENLSARFKHASEQPAPAAIRMMLSAGNSRVSLRMADDTAKCCPPIIPGKSIS